jgi:hypothetical protein
MVHIRDLIAFMAARGTKEPANAGQPGRQPTQPNAGDLNFANIDLSTPLASAKIVREILYAPPSMPALDLLAKMQAILIFQISIFQRRWRRRRSSARFCMRRLQCRRSICWLKCRRPAFILHW